MTIRSKLWLLLLAIGLVPMSFLALFFLNSTRDLGRELTENASDALRARELAYLDAKVAGNAALLGNHFDLLLQAVEDQARGVEAALAAADGFEDLPYAMASDIDRGRAATARDPLYQRLGSEGEAAAVPVVLDRVAIHLPPGSPRAERGSEMARLATLAPTYARLHDIGSARTIWHYTSLEKGVHSAWPGHGGYPEDYDPRARSWYREAMAADGPVISRPLVDVTTRRVVTSVSKTVRGPGGQVVGVTGIDVSVPGIFDAIAGDPRQWGERGEAMIVGLERAGEISVYARDRYEGGALAWDARLQAEPIQDADDTLGQRLRESLATEAVGLFQYPHRDRDALWAFAPIPGTGSFLVVVVPMTAVLARAQEMEAFVTERFAWQASVATGGFVLLSLLVSFVAFRTARGVTRPLADLSRTATAIAAGDLERRSSFARQDEIGALSDSINDMAQSIEKLLTAQEESYFQALKSLTKALEAKDAYTAAHSGRVNRNAKKFGRRLGLDRAELDLLGRAALVHDLGKIGVPESILNKPAPLDEEEFAVMRDHPRHSAAIMRPLMRFKAFAEIAAWHHERWDGTGYPDGLEGEAIPLMARIVSIADAWDAMTGDRVYRKGMTVEKALAILEEEQDSGQFDPAMIREFIAMIREEQAGRSR
jgi:HAMP domain-containing protein